MDFWPCISKTLKLQALQVIVLLLDIDTDIVSYKEDTTK